MSVQVRDKCCFLSDVEPTAATYDMYAMGLALSRALSQLQLYTYTIRFALSLALTHLPTPYVLHL